MTAIGVLLALLLAIVLNTLQEVVLAVFIAAFIALGLDPAIRFFQRRKFSRAGAIVTVIMLAVAVFVGVIWVVIPPVVSQAISLVKNFPSKVAEAGQSDWFINFNAATGGVPLELLNGLSERLGDPAFWSTIGGGALQFGLSLANGVTIGIFVFVLTIYFIASLDTIKRSAYSLVSKSRRATFEHYSEQILSSVGAYLSGMVTLAFFNAIFSVIILTLVGVPYAFLFGMIALFITLIPLIGTVITSTLMTFIALFTSPTAALIVGIAMLIYMQIEAYILTPKVMSKAVSVPGSVVLISALAGGTLLGLLGALVAIPVSAGILLIVKSIVIPAREAS